MPENSLIDTKRRKPRTGHKPDFKQKPGRKPKAPKTSAVIVPGHTHSNLTLEDWLTVVSYYDNNQPITQEATVEYFKARKEGALIFSQSALCRHLSVEGRKHDQDRLQSNPTALSSKRVRIVTRPDVEKALVLWVRHMEEKGHHVTGPMLVEKRRSYGLREIRRHGEAGSVNLENVAQEQQRIMKIVESYAKKDRWNFDETGLFGFAPPDHGLATQQLAGTKKDKFRVTLGLACNADGSEKLPILFIGKSKQPRCFMKRTPQQLGFQYESNKSAWMTAMIFEKWVKAQDLYFRQQGRKILLLVDNFSGHIIDYKPTNIHIEFFEPNLTSFVQPLDAGIIRCFKAHYRHSFCQRAIEQDEARAENIYKVTLLEVIQMAEAAWTAVTALTISNCWDHTQIQENFDVTHRAGPCYQTIGQDAWQILRDFASSDGDMSLPMAEAKLKQCLGASYRFDDWKPAFDAVLSAENDVVKAFSAIDSLAKHGTHLPFSTLSYHSTSSHPSLPQLSEIELELERSVNDLKMRRRIRGAPLTLDDMLNPVEEREIGDPPHRFPGGDAEIIAQVMHESRGSELEEVMDIDSSESEAEGALPPRQVMNLCMQLEQICPLYPDAPGVSVLELQKQLRWLRAHARKLDMDAMKQSTLEQFFK